LEIQLLAKLISEVIVANLIFLTNGNRGERFSLVIFENMFVTVMKKTRLFTKSMVFDYRFKKFFFIKDLI